MDYNRLLTLHDARHATHDNTQTERREHKANDAEAKRRASAAGRWSTNVGCGVTAESTAALGASRFSRSTFQSGKDWKHVSMVERSRRSGMLLLSPLPVCAHAANVSPGHTTTHNPATGITMTPRHYDPNSPTTSPQRPHNWPYDDPPALRPHWPYNDHIGHTTTQQRPHWL